MKDQTGNVPHIDCLQTAFSLKIRLVLISASAIARTTLRYNKGLVSSLLFFLQTITWFDIQQPISCHHLWTLGLWIRYKDTKNKKTNENDNQSALLNADSKGRELSVL